MDLKQELPSSYRHAVCPAPSASHGSSRCRPTPRRKKRTCAHWFLNMWLSSKHFCMTNSTDPHPPRKIEHHSASGLAADSSHPRTNRRMARPANGAHRNHTHRPGTDRRHVKQNCSLFFTYSNRFLNIRSKSATCLAKRLQRMHKTVTTPSRS